MRKALIPAFLLVIAAIVLGSTLFREQLAQAASPFTNVVVGNTSTNPVPVQQQGTASVNVTNSSVPVHEQGTASVNVANTPEVQVSGTVTTASADTTSILYEGDLCGTSNFAGPIDTASSGSIRVGATAVTTAGADDLLVQTNDTAAYFFQIGDLTVPAGGEADAVYKLPATKIALDCSGPEEIHVVIYGRP